MIDGSVVTFPCGKLVQLMRPLFLLSALIACISSHRISMENNPQQQQACSLLKAHSDSQHRPLVFLHIPKTGGTSAKSLLAQAAQTANLTACFDLRLPNLIFDQQTFAPVSDCDVLIGHLFYGIVDGYNAAKNPIYSVILRDPIERVMSLYYYVLKYPEHYQVIAHDTMMSICRMTWLVQ